MQYHAAVVTAHIYYDPVRFIVPRQFVPATFLLSATRTIAVNSPFKPITATLPIAPYLGGKRNLAKRVCAILDAQPHSTYAEPFVSMGGIFLRRTQRPRAEVINDYGPDTLFYLDPPYFGCEADYGKSVFERGDFARMATQLAGIKGRFLMSINDVPQIRETFGGFRVEALTTTYSVAVKSPGQGKAGELLIGNFDW